MKRFQFEVCLTPNSTTIQISSKCWVLRSAKQGALIATIFNDHLSLLTTRATRASCSISSAMFFEGIILRVRDDQNWVCTSYVFFQNIKEVAMVLLQVVRSPSNPRDHPYLSLCTEQNLHKWEPLPTTKKFYHLCLTKKITYNKMRSFEMCLWN